MTRHETTKGKEMKWKVKGIISAERPCELCGNTNLERNVVLENKETGEIKYVGTTCAGYMIYGRKSAKHSRLVTMEANAHEYATKWTEVHGTSEKVLHKIADAIRVHYCPATVWHGELLIGSQMETSN